MDTPMSDSGDWEFLGSPDEDFKPKPPRQKRTPEAYLKKLEKQPKKRSAEEWSRIFEFYPTEPDGYMKVYQPHQKAEFKAALDKYGFVVIKVLDEKQCDATVSELFMDLNRRAENTQKVPIDMNDPETWETKNWPSRSKFLVGTPAFTQRAFENRTNPVIYDIFCHIFGRKDLWCNIDNWGLFRPTKNIQYKDGVRDRDEWRYCLKLHWDYNPWVLRKWAERNDPNMYQGLVALVDCSEKEGSFACVPCSTSFVNTWTDERVCPRMNKASIRLPESDPMQNYIQHVPLRKGELVIWNSALAHCNFPNNSSKWRLHQFVRMLPADKLSNDKDRYAPLRIMHKHRDDPFMNWKSDLDYLSPLGRKLIGLDHWGPEDRPADWNSVPFFGVTTSSVNEDKTEDY